MFSVVIIKNFVQISANFHQICLKFLQKLLCHCILLQMMGHTEIILNFVFVDATSQQNQNNLILLKYCSNIFYDESRKNLFEEYNLEFQCSALQKRAVFMKFKITILLAKRAFFFGQMLHRAASDFRMLISSALFLAMLHCSFFLCLQY